MTENDRQKRVLIVEDDPHAGELLTFLMEDAGLTAMAANHGLDALEIMEKQVVDVIICDIMMPVMNGFDFREKILAMPEYRDVGFIFLSAKSMPEDEIKGLRYGVDEYITKPFNPDVLVARVEAVLTRRATLAKASQLDSLTQVYNRRTGEREIKRELERVTRYNSMGTLAFLDLDNFKSINDKHGHAIGDQALVKFADVLKQNIRSVDIVARYGGEEFLLYFPETGEAKAISVIERMQNNFQKMSKEELGMNISFSAGVTEAPRDGKEFHEICERADKAMYIVKARGKAKVLSWRQLQESMKPRPR